MPIFITIYHWTCRHGYSSFPEWYSDRLVFETAEHSRDCNLRIRIRCRKDCHQSRYRFQLTLRYLGVPVLDKSYMFGDNKSVVTSSTIPHSKLNKRHNALSYHRVREAIAAKIIDFLHIDGRTNPADVLSKHCGHVDAWPHLKWLLFWQGSPPEQADGIPRQKGETQV